jgi:hypothetical protein
MNALSHKLFHSNETINKINKIIKRGSYSPYTDAANYYVVKSNGDKMLAHALANFNNP